MIGKGFLFDGIDDYVVVPPDPWLNVGGQGSISLWMRADPTNLMDTCCQGLATTDYFDVEIGSAPAGVVFYVNTGGGWYVRRTLTPVRSALADFLSAPVRGTISLVRTTGHSFSSTSMA